MSMTWDLLQSGKHDLTIRGGALRMVDGADEVRQRILITLQHHWQEYFLNVPAGLPWYELILGSKDKRMVEALLRRAVLSVPNVSSIIGLQANWSSSVSRQLDIVLDVEAITIYGVQAVSIQSNLSI